MSSKLVAKTLYRSLLRAAKPFVSSYNGPILCSLLYRTGIDDDYYDTINFLEDIQREQKKIEGEVSPSSGKGKEAEKKDESKIEHITTFKDVHLSQEEARDLTKSYDELQKIHFDSTNETFNDDEWPFSSLNAQELLMNESDYYTGETKSPHISLYKQLLRQLFFDDTDGVLRQMQFPTQTMSPKKINHKNKMGEHEQNTEDRDCVMGQKLVNIIQAEFRSSKLNNDDTLSKFHKDTTRRETGFLALRELQKKLTWAESIGIQNLFHYQSDKMKNGHMSMEEQEERKRKREEEEKQYRAQAAKDVEIIPTLPSSSYLQTGAFLLAHPMLGGIFAKSVICILQHTDEVKNKSLTSSGDGDKDNDDNDGSDDDETAFSNHNGGTYGLVINNPLTVGVPGNDLSRRRDRTLREVIRHDSLPEGVRRAFGDCPVRNGGPVNLSIQMLRLASSELEEKLQIGGTAIPTVFNENSDDIRSSAMTSDNAVYYGGDIIKAAQAVIDGDMDKDAFSFVIGASCWEDGQLESEIAKGYWIPCGGPPTIAMTGKCDHNMNQDNIRSNVWLSMMCSLDSQEARLAHLLVDEVPSENGDACDEFR